MGKKKQLKETKKGYTHFMQATESVQPTIKTEQEQKIPSSIFKFDSAPEGHNYVLEVPENVEKIIRDYIRLLPHNEWSGALFYTVEGDFTSSEFKVICKDILLLDIGEGAHTQFTTERLIADYMAEKPELLDCYNGLVHSHHVLGAFISGEDQGTLHQEGVNRNNFVSLVVDARGTYVAAITRRVEIETTFTPHSTASYPFFSQRVIPLTITAEPDPISKKQYVVQCFPMTVIRHETSDTNDYFDKFAELLCPALKSLTRTHNTQHNLNNSTTNNKPYTPFTGYSDIKPIVPQGSLIKEHYEFNDGVEDVYPQIPFPKINATSHTTEKQEKEDTKEYFAQESEWEEIQILKEYLILNRDSFNSWLLKLLSGTPLKCLTEHIQWSSATGERIMNSWRESLSINEFETFMSTWIPECIAVTPEELNGMFEGNRCNADFDTLERVFFLFIHEELTSELEYDEYVEVILEILENEYDYENDYQSVLKDE